jgi:predicted MPP superfamily phosphohydrolase
LSFVTYTYPQRPTAAKLDSVLALPDSVYRVLLVHQPAMPLVRQASEKGYNLFLAGHTHGGGVSFGLLASVFHARHR